MRPTLPNQPFCSKSMKSLRATSTSRCRTVRNFLILLAAVMVTVLQQTPSSVFNENCRESTTPMSIPKCSRRTTRSKGRSRCTAKALQKMTML
ncbi:MAG TPA: hypothetical protein D7H87_07600 [Candidatus Poseidoniales archaeon]|nr:MAG TPA: hypothetical protein D7H87_07600 [Candidatus Poseidoniales archaeon]